MVAAQSLLAGLDPVPLYSGAHHAFMHIPISVCTMCYRC